MIQERKKELTAYVQGLEKAELHIHIEGAAPADVWSKIAKRNGLPSPNQDVALAQRTVSSRDLAGFLGSYTRLTRMLLTELDFYDLMYSYFLSANQQNIGHVEVFFDTQSYRNFGLDPEMVIKGLGRALDEWCQKLGMTGSLILCFLRNLPVDQAYMDLELAQNYKQWIVAVGLAAHETGHPPTLFAPVYQKARNLGFKTVAHAGEDGPPEYVWSVLNDLEVDRIDHGGASIQDPKLVAEIARRKIPLTMCPISNVRIGVVQSLELHPFRRLMQAGVRVTINSDNPAYFGSLIDNYVDTALALDLGQDELSAIARTSIEASFKQ